MEILSGSSALSEFRIKKWRQIFKIKNLPVTEIDAEYVHFVDIRAPLAKEEQQKLDNLLTYGPRRSEIVRSGRLFLVTPRPGTLSPWSSKATDIAHNCGLTQIKRIERGIAYYFSFSCALSESQEAFKTAS